MRSEFATAADILPKAKVRIKAPTANRTAENARRMRPSDFIVIANYRIEPFYAEVIEKKTRKIGKKCVFQLNHTADLVWLSLTSPLGQGERTKVRVSKS